MDFYLATDHSHVEEQPSTHNKLCLNLMLKRQFGDGSYLGAGEDLGPIGPLSQVLEHY